MEHKKTSERAFEFACHLIDEFRSKRPRDDAERLIWQELLKAGTSVGANTSYASRMRPCRSWSSACALQKRTHRTPRMLAGTNVLSRPSFSGRRSSFFVRRVL
jgi:hypothetical protein